MAGERQGNSAATCVHRASAGTIGQHENLHSGPEP
jgi:hypothetical protein